MIKKYFRKNLIGLHLFVFLSLMLIAVASASAETTTISWDANTEPDIAGYLVAYGTASRSYSSEVNVPGASTTSVEISGLEAGKTYYFAVRAVDLAGQLSDYSDEVTRTFALPNVAPAASFTTSPDTGIAPAQIAFTSTSTDSDGSITSTQWDFGDGTSASGVSVSHTFTTAGTYTVSLTVTDNEGAASQTSSQIVIAANRLPTASIDIDRETGFAPLEINFSGTGSTDEDGSVTDYAWDFGDGVTAGGETVTHIYENAGTYTVTLTVTDDKGGTDTVTAQVVAKEGHEYTWVLGENEDSDLMDTCSDTYLNINDENYAASPSLRTYTWPTDSAANAIVMKWNLDALPRDAVIESATLELYLEDAGGDSEYEISAHRISGLDPVIDACTGNTYDGTNPWTNGTQLAQDDIAEAESVVAVDAATGFKAWNITGMVQAWLESAEQNHGLLLNADTVASSDSYRYFASSDATDRRVRPRLTITFITEQQPDLPPRAEAAADRLSGKAPLTVNFTSAGSHDAEGSLQFSWNFGDGNSVVTASDASHEYTSPGTYSVVLTVTDSAGQTDTAELTVEVVANQAPQAVAQTDVTSGDAPVTVLFDASGSSDSDGSIVKYSWDYDSDGVEDAEGMTVEHTFTEAGEYHITLTVTDDSGETSSDSALVIIVTSNTAPEISNLVANPAVLENPHMSTIISADVTDADGDSLDIIVDCGNGQTVSGLPAECGYTKKGTYTVTVTVSDGNGNTVQDDTVVEVGDKRPDKPVNITLLIN